MSPATSSLPRTTMQPERLAQIREMARKLILKTGQKDDLDTICPESVHIPPLNLPPPSEVLAQYEYRNLPPGFLIQCTKHLSRHSQNLCTRYEETCRKLARTPYDTVDDSHTRKLCGRLAISLQECHSRVINRIEEIIISAEERMNSLSSQRSPATQSPNRSKFKYEYSPLLEAYFKNNAYPSTADKILLAQKTSMSRRQIEVWFQNHRNRSKKEGCQLRKSSRGLPKPIEDPGSYHSSSSPEPFYASDVDDSGYASQTVDDGLAPMERYSKPTTSVLDNWTSPSFIPVYTFPARYSQENRVRIPRANLQLPHDAWIRRFRSNASPTEPIDVHELTNVLARKLSLKEHRGSSQPEHHNERRTSNHKLPEWRSPTLLFPQPAPLPAFIPTARQDRGKDANRTSMMPTDPMHKDKCSCRHTSSHQDNGRPQIGFRVRSASSSSDSSQDSTDSSPRTPSSTSPRDPPFSPLWVAKNYSPLPPDHFSPQFWHHGRIVQVR